MGPETEEERLLLDNFAPDVLLGRRPHGKRVWLVVVNDAPRMEESQQPRPALVLIQGGKQD